MELVKLQIANYRRYHLSSISTKVRTYWQNSSVTLALGEQNPSVSQINIFISKNFLNTWAETSTHIHKNFTGEKTSNESNTLFVIYDRFCIFRNLPGQGNTVHIQPTKQGNQPT